MIGTISVAAQVFDTIMSIPGMSELVLLLNSIIERGLSCKGSDNEGVLANVPQGDLGELKAVANENAAKSGAGGIEYETQ